MTEPVTTTISSSCANAGADAHAIAPNVSSPSHIARMSTPRNDRPRCKHAPAPGPSRFYLCSPSARADDLRRLVGVNTASVFVIPVLLELVPGDGAAVHFIRTVR